MPPFDLDFKPKPKKYNPVIGDYGQRAQEPRHRKPEYDLPAWADPAYLNTLSEQELNMLMAGIRDKRKEVETGRQGQQVRTLRFDDYMGEVPGGNTRAMKEGWKIDNGVIIAPGGARYLSQGSNDEQGGGGGYFAEEDVQRQQAEDAYDQMLGKVQGLISDPAGRGEYERSSAPSKLAGELGAAGYEFMPGFLGDAANRQALYESRDNLLGYARGNRGNVAKGGFGNAYQLQNRGLWSGAQDPFGLEARKRNDSLRELQEEGQYPVIAQGGYNPSDPGGQAIRDAGTGGYDPRDPLGQAGRDAGIDLTPAKGFRPAGDTSRYSKPSRLPGFLTGGPMRLDFGDERPRTDMRSLSFGSRRPRYQPRWV